MESSPDRVLDFGPSTHRGVRWAKGGRTNLLWPVRAWRVVTPQPGRRALNVIERVVLRLHASGTHEYARMGELLGLDPALLAIVTEELVRTGAVDDLGEPTKRGHELLDDAVFDSGDMRVGWVFQDTWSGALLPRFVTTLSFADAEFDDDGRAWISSGPKGNPRRDRAFIQAPGRTPALPPTVEEIIDAARRHGRHVRRWARARETGDVIPAETIRQVALVCDEPTDFHLLTFVYVPETPEIGGEPWYVADPFGFGASSALREQLAQIRDGAGGGLRDVLDRMTGASMTRAREHWLEMRALLEEQARDRVLEQFPLGTCDLPTARERLIAAAAELASLEEDSHDRRRVDGLYLRLRQSLEAALAELLAAAPPGDAWRKLYRNDRSWLRSDMREPIVTRCAEAAGFETPIPKQIASAKPGTMRHIVRSGNASSLRPLCALLVLAAADTSGHPLRRIAAEAPTWLADVDRVASAAGAEVHLEARRRSLAELQDDLAATIRICRQVAEALSSNTE